MNSIQDILNGIRENKDSLEDLKKREPDRPEPKNTINERQYWVQKTADMLKVPFKAVLWKTINWPMPWVRDHYLQCTKPEVDNPARLWWGLIKKSNNKI